MTQHFIIIFCIFISPTKFSFFLQVRMVWGGGGWSGWTTPLCLLLLLVSVASPAPFKEEWPESWPEATDLAFPEEGILV
jgi:hypothetical protein